MNKRYPGGKNCVSGRDNRLGNMAENRCFPLSDTGADDCIATGVGTRKGLPESKTYLQAAPKLFIPRVS